MKIIKNLVLKAFFVVLAALGCEQAYGKVFSITTYIKDDVTLHHVIADNQLVSPKINTTDKTKIKEWLKLNNSQLLVEDYFAKTLNPPTQTSKSMEYYGKDTSHIQNFWKNIAYSKKNTPFLELRHDLDIVNENGLIKSNHSDTENTQRVIEKFGLICYRIRQILDDLQQQAKNLASNPVFTKIFSNLLDGIKKKTFISYALEATNNHKILSEYSAFTDPKSRSKCFEKNKQALYEIGIGVLTKTGITIHPNKLTKNSLTIKNGNKEIFNFIECYNNFKKKLVQESHDLINLNMLLKVYEALHNGGKKTIVLYTLDHGNTQAQQDLLQKLGFVEQKETKNQPTKQISPVQQPQNIQQENKSIKIKITKQVNQVIEQPQQITPKSNSITEKKEVELPKPVLQHHNWRRDLLVVAGIAISAYLIIKYTGLARMFKNKIWLFYNKRPSCPFSSTNSLQTVIHSLA